ncbi:MAG: bifunctional ADP-dependent (S)-NAD(P)H-hydrate dehydratase/NAD(P)H-hydrate epimerase [Propionibacterium sp.]|nr:MAG: bifunctional ADP-dependent (S)-NAD(P)H-hydrate dehydratase/NAD(P)H-hydrate epimerase [Propionibacterium sp.]
MIPVYSVSEIRKAEAERIAQIGGEALMRQAADAVVDQILLNYFEHVSPGDSPRRGRSGGGSAKEQQPDRILFVVGSGNNGGDALYAAAKILDTYGNRFQVCIWPCQGKMHAGGQAAVGDRATFIGLRDLQCYVEHSRVIVDGAFGIGARGGLTTELKHLKRLLDHETGKTVIAIDQPSGYVADSAASYESLPAHEIVTFGGRKISSGADLDESKDYGDVRVAKIGLALPKPTIFLAEKQDIADLWPVPTPDCDKYARGVVGVDTGSAQYPGAAVLGCLGAVYSGAGMVRYLGAAPVRAALLTTAPSVVQNRGRVDAWVIGSGWGDRPRELPSAMDYLESELPVVVDAGAIDQMPPQAHESALLTPHYGELARLLGASRKEVAADPIESVRRAAAQTGATVLLKGGSQYVARPDGQVYVPLHSNSWAGQAGAGDALAGVCGTLLAAGLEPWQAGLLAASIQAFDTKLHANPRPPEEFCRAIPGVVDRLLRESD